MAQFRGLLQGSGEQLSRLGGKKSGVSASANGWSIGFDITANYDVAKKQDYVSAELTGGSHHRNDSIPKIWVIVTEDGAYCIRLDGKVIAEKGEL